MPFSSKKEVCFLYFRTPLIFLIFFLYPALSLPRPVQQPAKEYAWPAGSTEDFENLVKRYRYYKPDSATYFANKGIAWGKAHHDPNTVAAMLNQLGMIEDNMGKPESSRQRYLQALAIYRQTRFQKGVAAVTVRLGVVELRKGKYDKAIDYFIQALKVSEKDGNKFGMMEANLTLAEAYMGEANYPKALHFLKLAESINDQLPFSNLTLNIYNNFGVIYRETREYSMAIHYLEKGIDLSNKPEYFGLHITLLNNLANVYARQGLVDKSIELQKAALVKARLIKNFLREMQTLTGLASSYGHKSPQKSLFYLHQALDLARAKGASKQEVEVLNELAGLYKFLGNYREAFLMKERAFSIADSAFYQVMSKKMDNLQAEYELTRSRAKVQELNFVNKQQRVDRNVMLGITGFVALLFIVLVFHYFKTRQLNNLLSKTNLELKETNRVKDKIFSVLGHDLRSPIASIISYLTYMNEDDDLPVEEKKWMLSALADSCTSTMEMLDNLLKWGETQIKGIRLNPRPIHPAREINSGIAVSLPQAQSKSLQLVNLVREELQVVCDLDHFQFIIRNLISNAIKFTSAGTITISAAPEAGGENVRFTVADTGLGISPDRLEQIFRIDNVSTNGTRDEKGTSLGLLLCKEFVEANNGMIAVESSLGKGSRFMFTLKKKVDHQEAVASVL